MSRENITDLLDAWSGGDPESLDQLLPLVYDELRKIAGRHLRQERPDMTWQSTEIVHEAYFRLAGTHRIQWRNRAHFFAIASQMMRRLLVDHARRQLYAKRGARSVHLPIEMAEGLSLERPRELIMLDEALDELAAFDPDKAKLVELRYFGGLSLDETAEVFGSSRATVVRQWRMAKAWLYRAFTGAETRETA